MIEIVSGTDRPNSNTLKIAKMLLEDYRALNVKVDLLDVAELNFNDVAGAAYKAPKGSFVAGVERATKAEGIVFVVPEYNGSFPGSLKMFIDYWKYPDTFEFRPVAFVGLGTRWGGLRPVEHLQQVFGYRNAYVFPHRVFISNIHSAVKDGKFVDPKINDLLKTQAGDFVKFIQALKHQGLDANSRLKTP
jgi:NAD(P)H-dependent FMN reductase